MISKTSVTVIIPTKNEAGGIEKVIKGVRPYCQEILVIDGHSNDQTVALAKKAGARVILDQKMGVGAAKRLGIRRAKGEIIVFFDGDGSHEPKDIPKLVSPIEKNRVDLVIASRIKGGSDEFETTLSGLVRQGGGDLIAAAINFRFKTSFTDTLNGFRAIRRSQVLKLQLRANDFDIEQEMLVKCLKNGGRVLEIASHEYARGWGQAKLPAFSKGWIFIWRLIKDLI